MAGIVRRQRSGGEAYSTVAVARMVIAWKTPRIFSDWPVYCTVVLPSAAADLSE